MLAYQQENMENKCQHTYKRGINKGKKCNKKSHKKSTGKNGNCSKHIKIIAPKLDNNIAPKLDNNIGNRETKNSKNSVFDQNKYDKLHTDNLELQEKNKLLDLGTDKYFLAQKKNNKRDINLREKAVLNAQKREKEYNEEYENYKNKKKNTKRINDNKDKQISMLK